MSARHAGGRGRGLITRLRSPRPGLGDMLIATGWFALTGLGLIIQSDRYSNTPAYANLIEVLPAQVWGGFHLAVAAALLAAITHLQARWATTAAITAAFALTGAWWVAFIIRWATDTGTTPVNPTNWVLMLFLLIRVATGIDSVYDRKPHERD